MEENFMNVWEKALEILKDEISQIAYNTYIEVMVPRLVDKNTVCFLSPSSYYIDICKKRYLELIRNTLKYLTSVDYKIIFEAKPTIPENEDSDLEDIDEIDDLSALEDTDENSEIKNIFDESVEEEIAKDVDEMFTARGAEIEELPDAELEQLSDSDDTIEELPEAQPELMSDDDLDTLDELSDGDDDLLMHDNSSTVDTLEEIEPLDDFGEPETLEEIGPMEEYSAPEDELIAEEDDSEDLEPLEDLADSDSGILGSQESVSLDMPEEKPTQNDIYENLTENNSLPGVPIYKADEPAAKSRDGMSITEGNIVYHEKYGRGVVEELFNYGKRTLCSIQFDNVGRRLLDPNLAELKQM